MATSKEEDKRRAESQRLARDLFGSFREEDGIAEIESVKTDGSLKKEVADIFEQAHAHRDKLVRFFIVYTWVFSGVVAVLIFGQALIRWLVPEMKDAELVPYWALNLLVIGLVGQFIALLTIVTKKVWLFEEFFKQASVKTDPDS